MVIFYIVLASPSRAPIDSLAPNFFTGVWSPPAPTRYLFLSFSFSHLLLWFSSVSLFSHIFSIFNHFFFSCFVCIIFFFFPDVIICVHPLVVSFGVVLISLFSLLFLCLYSFIFPLCFLCFRLHFSPQFHYFSCQLTWCNWYANEIQWAGVGVSVIVLTRPRVSFASLTPLLPRLCTHL